MKTSLRQQVLDLCDIHGCALIEYHGSHFVIASKTTNDSRTWITNSHSLTGWCESSALKMYGDILDDMKQGFVDTGKPCDDGEHCDICSSLSQVAK
jgi:hypothetical protein